MRPDVAGRMEGNEEMKTLLQKAKAVTTRTAMRRVTEEEIELAVAWAKGEISYSQAMVALNGNDKSQVPIYSRLAIALRDYIQKTMK